jgi:hypothetical protein
MNGPLHIDRVEMKLIHTGSVCQGILVYNDDRQTYCLTPTALAGGPKDILKDVLTYADDVITGLIDDARENVEGIFIDDFFHEWGQLT